MKPSVNRTVVIRHVSGRLSSSQSEFDSNFGHHKRKPISIETVEMTYTKQVLFATRRDVSGNTNKAD
jgi:hypothetical protein